MSGTPAASTQSPDSATASQDLPASATAADRIVLEYLRARGYKSAEQALLQSVQPPSPEDKGKKPESSVPSTPTVSSDDFVKRLAVFAEKPSQPGQNALKESSNVQSELSTINQPINIQNLLASIGNVGAEEILSTDPTDKTEGFTELKAWVDGSLDMYRPQFRPILFPIFVHFYLDLVQFGFKEAALRFFSQFSPSLNPRHTTQLRHLYTLLLPSHVQNDELAQAFRNTKYTVRMSRSGFGLLIGWLTEGVGGEALGSGEGFAGERGKRGRTSIMRVVNNHLRFDVTATSATAVSPDDWEENTGLLSSVIPQASGSSHTSAESFNASKGELKLGPAPLPEELRSETERVLREQAMVDRDPTAQYDLHYARPQLPPGVVTPSISDLLPQPPSFKTIDVKREVEKVRDARKRIRLDPSVLGNVDINAPQASTVRARVLPSICCYTIHDAPEGATCTTFSPDTSLMAAGFSESYIRLWSLKGEKLRGMRSDFQTSAIRDPASLRRARERGGSTTRKLIGHSGPVYALSFDPLSGSASPPKYLLSASADATARLWSLDTMSNVVAYSGHQNPVWDVQWSPMGIYFATGSRDRTARLWSTDRTSCLRVYADHLSDVDCVRFHPNGLYLGTGSSDRVARLFDVQKGSLVRVFLGHTDIVNTLAFSPDGRYLATASEDLSVSLWDVGSGRRIKKMTGHTASIYSLAFSAESSLLVSGGADWTVRCWDVKSAGGLPTVKRENGAVTNGISSENEPKSRNEETNNETTDLLATFPTKRTPILDVEFTPRNLCLVAGSYLSPEHR